MKSEWMEISSAFVAIYTIISVTTVFVAIYTAVSVTTVYVYEVCNRYHDKNM